MANQASAEEIVKFLVKAKKLLSMGEYIMIPRRKNMQALAQLGFTIIDAKNEILDLATGDYYKGPKQDFDLNYPGDVWEFKKDVGNIQFYVKLKIEIIQGKEILKCLSFHEDEFSG